MKVLVAAFAFVTTTSTLAADTIGFDLGKRAKKFVPSYVNECKEVLKQQMKIDNQLPAGDLDFILTDIDENVMAKYLWWVVVDKATGKTVGGRMMQKPTGGKCF